MAMKIEGRAYVRVDIPIADRFLYHNAMVDRVWLRLRLGEPRSNAVHYAGSMFYDEHSRIRGRMHVSSLPVEVRNALDDAVCDLAALRP